ncbi:hypothetical protein [Methyloceanibacter caenitepidi]|uniref:Phage protein n=1 Tax=Methyloceanibacter caenitepidi TaxID=1384459 RepID=A0A0A8K4M2_9HYPH|nr:hypothetical protein [Methyloceanibacter caenitepidi]BAQ16944.1 phage protein [Methyloceanibacter caenitepidi]
MTTFRKKPVEIEAVRCRDVLFEPYPSLPFWMQMAINGRRIVKVAPNVGLQIATLEGTMSAEPDDWIIRGVKGEIYPCKPDVFEATYEPVEDKQP